MERVNMFMYEIFEKQGFTNREAEQIESLLDEFYELSKYWCWSSEEYLRQDIIEKVKSIGGVLYDKNIRSNTTLRTIGKKLLEYESVEEAEKREYEFEFENFIA